MATGSDLLAGAPTSPPRSSRHIKAVPVDNAALIDGRGHISVAL